MAKASDNNFPSILVTEQAAKPTAPASGSQRIYMKTDHALYHEGNDAVEHVLGNGLSYTARATYTGSNITLSSTSFVDVDASLAVTLNAQEGDVIMVGVGIEVANAAVDMYFDACTWVSSAVGHYISNGSATPPTDGVTAWYCAPSAYIGVGGSIIYTLVSGDVSGGTVTLHLHGRVYSGSRVLYATTAAPIIFWAINLSR